MYVTITSIVLLISLMFGGTGAAVFAAQDSLPNQSLYQVKTFSEDIAARFSQRNNLRLHLELEFASRRVNEIVELSEMGVNAPDSVLLRLNQHLDQALETAARTEEADMLRDLSMVRERLQLLIRSLNDVPFLDPIITRAREMIQSRLQWAELGLDDPSKFRYQVQIRTCFKQPPEIETGYGPGPGPLQEQEPGEGGYSPGPHAMGTPTPEKEQCTNNNCSIVPDNGIGTGPNSEGDHSGECLDPTPTEGNGPGPGSEPDHKPDSGSLDVGSGTNNDQNPGNSSNNGNGGKP